MQSHHRPGAPAPAPIPPRPTSRAGARTGRRW